MTYHRIYTKNNIAGTNGGAGTAYTFGTPQFTRILFMVRVAQSFFDLRLLITHLFGIFRLTLYVTTILFRTMVVCLSRLGFTVVYRNLTYKCK